MNVNYLIAIICGVLSFSLKNIGYVLQKKGVNQVITRYSSLRKKIKFIYYLKTRIWCIGIFLPFIGGVTLIIAYAYGPISMIMPFTGIGFIFLVLFVKFFLKEQIAPIEWLSICINLAGITLINLKVMNIQDSYSSVISLFSQFLTLKGILFLFLPNIIIISFCVYSSRKKHSLRRTFYAVGAGIIGGTSLLFQKPFSIGIKGINNELSSLVSAIIIISGFLFISLSIIAIIFLNTGYKYGRGILVAPLYAIFQMIFPLLGGVLIFNEWKNLDQTGILLQIIGIVLIIFASGILAYFNEKKIVEKQK